jgi:hypothetical protein
MHQLRFFIGKILFGYILSIFLFFSDFIKTMPDPPSLELRRAESDEERDIWLVVLVHGNMDLRPHIFSWENLMRFIRDDIAESAYLKAVTILRADPFFYQHHAMQGLGLQKIDMNRIEPGYAAGAFAQAHNYINHWDTKHFVKTDYFTYGWSGLQSAQTRLADAQLLYQALVNKAQEYRKLGFVPHICLIGYSHGANVVLNAGAWYNEKDSMKVDQLVLVGLPVIPDSYSYVASPLFKAVYHIYSLGDRVQPLDCLGSNRFFSARLFSAHADFKLPDNLYQIRVRVQRIARIAQTKNYPPYKKYPNPVRKSLIRNADPGHVELWSFGWANSYRDYFPLFPIPLGVYSSLLINVVHSNTKLGNFVTIDIAPFKQTISAQNQKTGFSTSQEFIPEEKLAELHDVTMKFQPNNYSGQLFYEKVQNVLLSVQQLVSPIT